MVEIEFSMIADSPEDSEIIFLLLQEFEAKYKIHVKLITLDWEQAWGNLLATALQGRGPHVSHIGSTWTASLAMMQALRTFNPKELRLIGAPEAFVPSAWQSVILEDTNQVSAIPWTFFTFIVSYRRDLLEQAGVDDKTALLSPESMIEALQRLQAVGIQEPLGLPLVSPDLLHIAANWVWGSGGSFITSDGKRTMFSEKPTRDDLKSFFELFRFTAKSPLPLDADACGDLFAAGKAAMIITGTDIPIRILQEPKVLPQVRANLAISNPPGVPWVGGDNLVIWKHILGHPEQEQAALALVSFLTSQTSQVLYARLGNNLPVRQDSYADMTFTPESLSGTIQRAVLAGRSHPAVRLWSRIEYQLGSAMLQIAEDLMYEPGCTVENALQKHLDPLARRLDLMLAS